MSLIDAFSEKCILMEKTRVSDGESGFTTTWTEGTELTAAITQDTSMQARIAEKQGVTSTWTITTSKAVTLDFHDIIKRVSDGRYFRVTSEGGDRKTPAVSSLDINQVTAEKWEMTT